MLDYAGELRTIGYGNFVVADAVIEAGEESSGLVGNDGGSEVGAGEGADGIEGAPGGFDEDFDFGIEAAKGDGGGEIAGYSAEFGKNVFVKVFEIF